MFGLCNIIVVLWMVEFNEFKLVNENGININFFNLAVRKMPES